MRYEVIQSIGGYFTLELPLRSQEYHSDAVALNSGKNAFEYILATYGYKIKKVFLPYFTSRIMIKPLKEHDIAYEFYHVNERLELSGNISLEVGEFLVYTNYFGLKDDYIRPLAAKYGNQLVVDNAQGFFDKPLDGVNTFYSPRKFFGVLDGGYSYSEGKEKVDLPNSISYDRMGYLFKRIDTSAEEAYSDYKSSCHLGDLPVSKMSKLTKRILGSVDYDAVAEARRRNYGILAEALSSTNKLNFELGDAVPLVYPYMSDDVDLRSRLIESKVYVAQYWPNVLDWCGPKELEYYLTTHIIPLPIDQRYGEREMNFIINKIIYGKY